MAGRESTNDPTVVNAGGYAGLYQFGAPRLAALHAYTPAAGEIDANGKWNGQMNGEFHIAGHPEVKTLADFLHSTQAQDAAFQSHVAGIDAAISQTPGADKLDRNGLRAVAHLGGIEGMQKFIATDGAYNPGDNPNAPGGGTHLADYYKRFAAGGAPALQAAFGHPDGPPQGRQQAAAPGVTLSPDQSAPAPASVQVAGPGAGSLPAAAPQPGTQGVDDVMARLRAGQGTPDPSGGADPSAIPGPDPTHPPPGYLTRPPQMAAPGPAAAPAAAPPQAAASPALAPTPGHTGPLAGVIPDGPLPPTAANGLAGSGPQPQLMPSASAAPPPGAVQAPVAPPQTGQPQAGQPPAPLVLLPNGLTQQQTTDFINLSNRRTTDPAALTTAIEAARQQNRTAQQQYFTDTKPDIQFTKTEDEIVGTDKRTGQVVSRQPITTSARVTSTATAGGTELSQPGVAPRLIPFSGRPEQTDAYKGDLAKADALTTAAQSAQASMPRLNEMAALAGQLATGPTAELRAKGAAMLEAAGASPEAIQRWTGMSSGSAAQEFIKLSIATAGSAAKADVGANNGIQSTQLYQAANPNLSLLPDANKRITNLMRVSAQSIQDYAQDALQHFGKNEDTFLKGGDYTPLTTFNRTWQGQNNPQVYAAATGILNGDPFDKWSAKISPAEGARAAQIAARIDPTVQVPMRGGGVRPVKDILAHPAVSGASP